MFENVFKLLKIKIKILYIFDTRGGGSTTRFLGLNHIFFLTILDNKINLTQQKFLSCSSRSAGHRGRSPGPHVLAAPQGRVAAAQVRRS